MAQQSSPLRSMISRAARFFCRNSARRSCEAMTIATIRASSLKSARPDARPSTTASQKCRSRHGNRPGTEMPPKKSRICFILGLDGGRQKFRLDANGEIFIRWNDQFMKALPARDTPRLDLEKQPVHFRFGLPEQPMERHIEEESIPTCITTWE